MGATAAEVAERRKAGVGMLERLLRGDLDWITLKSLDKERSRRYQAATELAADLERYLKHEAVLASPPNLTYRVRKFLRRNRMAATAAAAVLLSLLIGLVASLHQAARAERARRARTQELVSSHVATGMRLAEEGENLDALPWLAEAMLLEEGGPEREEAHRRRIASTLDRTPRLLQIFFHEGAVNNVAFSPDARLVLSASDDGTARLWEVASGRERASFRHEDRAFAIFNRDGSLIATTSADRTARVWDARTGQPITPPLPHEDRLDQSAFSPDSALLATTALDHSVSLFRTDTGERLFRRPFDGGISALEFSPDGRLLAIAEITGSVTLLDPASNTVAARLPPDRVFLTLEFHPTEPYLLTGGWTATVWDTRTARRIGPRIELGQQITSASFSHDATKVVTASADSTVRIWDLESRRELGAPIRFPSVVDWAAFSPTDTEVLLDTGQLWRLGDPPWMPPGGVPLTPVPRHSGSRARTVDLSPDGRLVATGGNDGTVRVWGLNSLYRNQARLEHPAYVFRARYSGDGTLIATGAGRSWSGFAQVWDISTREPRTPPLRHAGDVRRVELTPDGTRVVTGSSDGSFRVWHSGTGEPLSDSIRLGSMATRIAISPDGRRFAAAALSGDGSGHARVFDGFSGAVVSPVIIHDSDEITSLEFSPDGTRILTASSDRTARLWDSETGEAVLPAFRHDDTVWAARFVDDGGTVVTAGDRTVRFWSASTGAEARPPLRWTAQLYGLNLGPRDGQLVTRSLTGEVGLSDWRRGHVIGPTLKHEGAAYSASFSPTGAWLLVSAGGTVRVWDARTGQAAGPAIPHDGLFTFDAEFSPDGGGFAVAENGGVRLWRLVDDERPREDVALHAQLVSGQKLGSGLGLSAMDSEELRNGWARLTESYPAVFEEGLEAVAARDRAEASDLLRAQRWEAAARLLNGPLARPNATSTDFASRGRAYAELGRWSDALADYRAALERRPASVELQSLVALIHSQLGNAPEHARICQTLLRDHGRSRNPDRATWIVRHCGIRGEAVRGYEPVLVTLAESVVDAMPDSRWALETLSLARYRNQDLDAASATLATSARAIQSGPSLEPALSLLIHKTRRRAPDSGDWSERVVRDALALESRR